MLPLSTAKKIAVETGNRLLPYCDRLNIAGSIRRAKYEVHDLEIVCQPKWVKTGQVDLFGVDSTEDVVHPEFAKIVASIGLVIKGKPDGRMMQIELANKHGGMKTVMLDLFMPQPHDYYRIYAIRTGSADYSAKVITHAWIRKGWRGTPDGLRLEEQCTGTKTTNDKTIWKCHVKDPELPPAWQSEQEFFDWLGIQYLPPNIRTVTQ
jgi:DNA polymerase/3'-5' exonuclease PolX